MLADDIRKILDSVDEKDIEQEILFYLMGRSNNYIITYWDRHDFENVMGYERDDKRFDEHWDTIIASRHKVCDYLIDDLYDGVDMACSYLNIPCADDIDEEE